MGNYGKQYKNSLIPYSMLFYTPLKNNMQWSISPTKRIT